MRIINKGYLNDKYTRICECNNCGCKFEADEDSFYVRIHFNYLHSFSEFKVIVECPALCDDNIILNWTEIPKVVYNRILKKKTIIKYSDKPETFSISDIRLVDGQYKINHGMFGIYLNSEHVGKSLRKLIEDNKKVEKKD